ncbi:hypothetical protein [Nocardioides marmoraquaticus]
MRLPRSVVVCVLVLVVAGCGGGGGSGSTEEPSGDRLDADGFQQLRTQTQQVGTDAFAAAAEAVGATDVPGSGRASAEPCSGAPDGTVRLTMGSTLVYGPPAPASGLDDLASSWEELGLDVSDDDGGLLGETAVDGVSVRVVIGSAIAAEDGSDRELRYLTLRSDCVDVGPDLARDLG